MAQMTEEAMLLAIKETMESALDKFAKAMKDAWSRDIQIHVLSCPSALDWRLTKARFVGLIIGAAAGGGGLGGLIAKLVF